MSDAAPLANDIVDARSWHVQGLRQRIGAGTERNQIILPQYFAGMNRPHAVLDHRGSPSVVVNDLDVFRAGRRPAETQLEGQIGMPRDEHKEKPHPPVRRARPGGLSQRFIERGPTCRGRFPW